MTLIRKADHTEALLELAEAAKLAQDNARYVYAIGLNSAGNTKQALAVLKDADAHHPFNMDILNALISIQLEIRDVEATLVYAKKAAEALPDNRQLKQLVELTTAR